MKVVTLLKIPTGQNPTVPVMAGNVMEEKPPHHPTPKRAELASAGQIMKAIQLIV